MKKLMQLVLIVILAPELGDAQQMYYFSWQYGFGIAEYSNCSIVQRIPLAKALPGATINIIKFPDGRLYRASEWDGGFFNDSIPVVYTPIKKHKYSDIGRINERAVSVCVDSRSLIYIVMRTWDDSTLSYLMEYDYTTGRFTILGNVNKGLRSILAVGNKLLGFEEILQPYRHYRMIQMNPYEPEKAKVLFTVDSTLWVKDYSPKHISPYLCLFKAYESCDQLNLMLSSFTNNDSLTRFYKIDFNQKKLVPACTIPMHFEFQNNEGYRGYDYLRECDFQFDFDLNNSTDSVRNCRIAYTCPRIEQEIHDLDWDYHSDGSLDSIHVEILSGNVDSINEYIWAAYLPPGAIVIGNRSADLKIYSTLKISGQEIKKILGGIRYKNDLNNPSPGERTLRTTVFIPWFEDTANSRITIPQFQNKLQDTSIWLCPQNGMFDLSALHFQQSINGIWMENDLNNGFINTSKTPSGTFHYLYQRVDHCPTDTAQLQLNYYENPLIELGSNTIAEGHTIQKINLNSTYQNIQSIQWFQNGQLVAIDTREFEFEMNQDVLIRVNVQTDDDCVFQDSIFFALSVDQNDIWIPDAFSPNGDQINDLFTIKGKYDIHIHSLDIFDRWGNLVFFQKDFSANDYTKSWNGFVNNQPVNPGTYIYQLVFAVTSGVKTMKNGTLHLIR
ncbi:MAG: gliding motility-associated C-terminal domain-containing protein [Saprospiraceae bacterium]|nr:gliding motility-associated C-terminal domain-containing protein [Saprospiraceae bacterium]